MKQTRMNLFKGSHGGRRPNAGRRRIHSPGVAHRTREKISHRTPMHVNFRYKTAIKNKDSLRLLKRAIVNARKMGLRVLHSSLQSNHVHVIVESESNAILSKGMRSLTITMARGLKKGRIQVGRYHLHVLRSIRETRNAIHYVLFNKQKHERGTCSTVDAYSSILGLRDGLKLIREFAKNRMTITIGRSDPWPLDRPKSRLAIAAVSSS